MHLAPVGDHTGGRFSSADYYWGILTEGINGKSYYGGGEVGVHKVTHPLKNGK